MWSIDRVGESAQTESLQSESAYFDAELNLISRRQNLKERYDPRGRSWFVSARSRNEQITTAPYVFSPPAMSAPHLPAPAVRTR